MAQTKFSGEQLPMHAREETEGNGYWSLLDYFQSTPDLYKNSQWQDGTILWLTFLGIIQITNFDLALIFFKNARLFE